MSEERKALSRDAILAAHDLRKQWVDIPEWGGGVFVRVMTAKERDVFEARFFKRNDKGDIQVETKGMRSAMVALTVVGDDGQRLFTEADVPALEEKSFAVLERIMTAANKVNGMGAGSTEEAAKNS